VRKRHEALQPLTHHHHHALVVALKLKRAGTEESKLSSEEIRQALRTFWEQGGQEHFREEEEILLPAYARHETLHAPEIAEALLEHVRVRSLAGEILEARDDSIEKMHELGDLLDAHVHKEERVIFPMIEDALPEEQLQALAPYFHMNHDQ
jgi:hemerythrin-like domain-containing protein